MSSCQTQFDDAQIFSSWKEKWISDTQECFQKPLANIPEEELFLKLFERIYTESAAGAARNRRKNIWTKRIFALSMAFCALVQLGVFLTAANILTDGTVPGCDSKLFTLENLAKADTFLLLACGIGLLALSKWNSIKKFQESWVRHAYTTFRYHRAMLLYLQGLPQTVRDSSTSGQSLPVLRQAFKEAIFEIMEENYKKFCKNMEEKEINLIQDVSALFK